MKQIVCLFLLLSFCFPISSRQEKIMQLQSCKKHEAFKLQEYHKSIVSVDNEKNMSSEMLNQLKRRYPRKYNLKYNLDKLERDDFGYAPENKKAYKI